MKHFVCRGDLAGLGTDGSRRVGLIDKAFRASRHFSRDLERMGRGGWVLLIQHFVCLGDLAGTWNGWVAARGSY